jgi:nucleotide-binding universal stress UspA family protein
MPHPFKTILCAVDFDDNRAAAMKTASELLAADGRLYLYHAATFPYALVDREARYPLSKIKERLEKSAAACLNAGTAFEVVVESSDDIARSIVEAAQRLSATSIVIATHARKSVDRFFLGSIAEQVVRQARCPVLTIPPAAAEEPVPHRS